MLQWYLSWKYGIYVEACNINFFISNYLLKQKLTIVVAIPQQKCQCLNNFSCVLVHQLQLDNNVSCCSQVDLLSAEAWHPTLLEGLPLGHWGSGVQGYDPLHDDLADPIGFLWDSGLEKVQATPFEVPQPPAAVSLMMRPQGAGALSSMKMKPGLCCSRRGTITGLMMLFR